MDTKEELQKLIADSLGKAFKSKMKPEEIHLEHPQDEKMGDWASNIAMILSKELKKNPREIAEEIVKGMKENDHVESVEVAGPGFINFKISEKIYKNSISEVLKKKDNYGTNTMLQGKRIAIEFAHPNPFKAFHIGHLRNIILGESLVRLLEAAGAEVIRLNYQGDVGMHIAKCLWAFKKIDPKDYPKSNDEKVALLGKAYAQGATAFEEDEKAKEEIVAINKKIYTKEDKEINKLWELGVKWSEDKFHELYERVYSHFDRQYMESETLPFINAEIDKAKSMGILKMSEGALIFDGKKHGVDTRVFLNQKGLPTYEGKQLGLVVPMELKDFGHIDKIIFNVAVEQISFFKTTIKVIELMYPELKGVQHHNAYEFVGLKSGKMSSRKGKVVLGNDILNAASEKVSRIVKSRKVEEISPESIEIIAVGAIKYSFLKISPFSYLAFDLEESLSFDGDSGPYIQYTYARAQSILRGIEGKELKVTNLNDVLNSEEEINVVKHLAKFPEIVEVAAKDYSPHFIVGYLFELAQRFNSFYKNHSVMKAGKEDKKARLALTAATAQVIKNGLSLLGIKTVEKM